MISYVTKVDCFCSNRARSFCITRVLRLSIGCASLISSFGLGDSMALSVVAMKVEMYELHTRLHSKILRSTQSRLEIDELTHGSFRHSSDFYACTAQAFVRQNAFT
jgi:hypothetical protein